MSNKKSYELVCKHNPDLLKKITDSLDVEIKEFFEFAHVAKNTKELKQTIKEFTRSTVLSNNSTVGHIKL